MTQVVWRWCVDPKDPILSPISISLCFCPFTFTPTSSTSHTNSIFREKWKGKEEMGDGCNESLPSCFLLQQPDTDFKKKGDRGGQQRPGHPHLAQTSTVNVFSQSQRGHQCDEDFLTLVSNLEAAGCLRESDNWMGFSWLSLNVLSKTCCSVPSRPQSLQPQYNRAMSAKVIIPIIEQWIILSLLAIIRLFLTPKLY